MASNAKKPGTTKAAAAPKKRWWAQIIETYKLTAKVDRKVGPILLATFFITFAIFLGIGFALKFPVFWGILGFLFALPITMIIFGRRAQAAGYAQVEGQPGAAAAVLQSMRGAWFVTPAVAITKNQDIVHRVVGRPGVILVAEAPVSRAANLLANERKRTARFLPETPILEISVGDGEGQVPLRKLQRKVMKMPRALKPAQVTDVRRRLEALTASPLPIPKGPLPKGARMPRTKG